MVIVRFDRNDLYLLSYRCMFPKSAPESFPTGFPKFSDKCIVHKSHIIFIFGMAFSIKVGLTHTRSVIPRAPQVSDSNDVST